MTASQMAVKQECNRLGVSMHLAFNIIWVADTRFVSSE